MAGIEYGRKHIRDRLNKDLISLIVIPSAHPCGKCCEENCLFIGIEWVKLWNCSAFFAVIGPVTPLLVLEVCAVTPSEIDLHAIMRSHAMLTFQVSFTLSMTYSKACFCSVFLRELVIICNPPPNSCVLFFWCNWCLIWLDEDALGVWWINLFVLVVFWVAPICYLSWWREETFGVNLLLYCFSFY